ncbi:RidA family protein [Arthrobacter sp. Edens01]|uniref:RidA family protein n=1 Tax=Arthrobacter sp. Edens01 TaxID=1732020 RepID=UPI0006DA60E3|nr:RidA family protein [Arthrobacter sp. Edens01]KPN18182.1 hypothetical protein AO716_09885 [Arthrobacter sp. Edens01]
MFSRIGEIVWTGGHLPRLPDGTIPESFADQARLVLEKIARTLETAGSGIDRLVKVNAYLSDLDDLPEFNDIYIRFLKGCRLPVRTSVEVTRFRDASKLEIEVIASSRA